MSKPNGAGQQNEGTGSQEQGSGDAGGEEQNTGDGGSLLEQEAENGGGESEGGEQNGGGEQGGGNAGSGQVTGSNVEDIVAAAVERAIAEANRVADRRINQVLQRLEGGQQPQGGSGGEGGGQGEGQGQGQQQQQSGPDRHAVRAARLAFREYVGSDLKFLGNEEREFAMSLGSRLVESRGQIDDEDQVGREVAAEVTKQVRSLRKFYEDRTKAALKSRGMLKDSPNGEQPLRGGETVGGSSEIERGAQIAGRLFPQRAGTQS